MKRTTEIPQRNTVDDQLLNEVSKERIPLAQTMETPVLKTRSGQIVIKLKRFS